MTWELAQFVAGPPDWFIDIGPGVPQSEAAEARRAWPQAQILGLEPCRERYESCRPEFPGVLLPVAAWSEDVDALEVYASPERNLWGLFAPPEIPPQGMAPGRSLDSLERQCGPFDRSVIWADIEGSELRMLRGALGLLRSGRVLALNLEVRPAAYAAGWCTEDEVDGLLAECGFGRARHYAERGRGHHYDVIYVPREATVLTSS